MGILGFSVRGEARKISKHLLKSLHGVINNWDSEDKHNHHYPSNNNYQNYSTYSNDPSYPHHHSQNNYNHHSDCDCGCDNHHSDCECDKHHYSDCNCGHHHHSNCNCGKHHDRRGQGNFLLKPLHNNCNNGHFVGKDCDVPLKVSPFFFGINNPRLNFNGLNGNLAFQLFRFKGCKVKIFLECPDMSDEVEGVICNVGTNFVDILMFDEKVVTVLIEHICKIEWLDKHCNPCPVCYFPCEDDHFCPQCGAKHDEEEEEEEEV
ncbi:hypothetical protein SFC55_10150 [Niallia taxi]|uniref:hypothetical protein n=1 Tax=Niallia taxi TaxID=2499688 RepID=UPI003981F8EE